MGWSTSSSHPWPTLEPQRVHAQECVQVCVWLRDQPLLGLLSSHVTLSWPGPSPLHLPRDLAPALPSSPLSWDPKAGSGPCLPHLSSTLTGFSLRCPQTSSARELPLESSRCICVTSQEMSCNHMGETGPFLQCWAGGFTAGLALARRREDWGLPLEGGESKPGKADQRNGRPEGSGPEWVFV